jgi:hypothetical protein
MRTKLERRIELEELWREEAARRFPGMDRKQVAERIMSERNKASRENIEIAALIGPEVMRVMTR